MAWSFVCPTEVLAFNARLHEFETRACSVVFASTDSEQVLRAWSGTPRDEGGLGRVHVPLLSDRAHRLARTYGVLDEEEGTAQRALFIIDPHGILRHYSVNDGDVGRSVDEARRLLDALVFTDEFGEGCPVDWRKGEPGIRLERRTWGADRPGIKRLTSWGSWSRPRTNTVASGTAGATRPSSVLAESPGVERQNPLAMHVLGGGPMSPVSPMGGRTEDVMSNFEAVALNGVAV